MGCRNGCGDASMRCARREHPETYSFPAYGRTNISKNNPKFSLTNLYPAWVQLAQAPTASGRYVIEQPGGVEGGGVLSKDFCKPLPYLMIHCGQFVLRHNTDGKGGAPWFW